MKKKTLYGYKGSIWSEIGYFNNSSCWVTLHSTDEGASSMAGYSDTWLNSKNLTEISSKLTSLLYGLE